MGRNLPQNRDCESRLEEAAREIHALKKTVDFLYESEEKFKTIFEYANDLIIYLDLDGRVSDVNGRIEDILGYTREEMIGVDIYRTGFFGTFTEEDLSMFNELREYAIAGGPPVLLDVESIHKDGHRVYLEINPRVVKKEGQIKGELAIIRDITKRKEDENNLRKHREKLEEMVKERTANLEEANAALKVLLKRREEDQKELEEKVLFNIKELVLPYVDKLKDTKIDNRQQAYMDILESNLRDIVSPYVHGIASRFLNLTPTEIQVANLIIEGRSSKEIAEILGVSKRTVDSHRRNVRDKMGIVNKKVNLRSLLMSFSS